MTSNAAKVRDFYARLGVDPGADRALIEAALERMQPAWSMGTRNPKTRHANQLYLDEIPALRRALLSDAASRAAYDAELAMIHAVERERKLDDLQKRVRLRAAKGGLTGSDRKLLTVEAAKLGFNEDELLRLTRPIPNLIETTSIDEGVVPDDDLPADVLDPSTRRQISVALEHLSCRDLYDALGVAHDAPVSHIMARADAERQRWMKKAQVTAEKTAWLEVIAHAQSHLSSPKTRARYDRTLVLEMEELFDSLTGFALSGLRRLDAGTHAALVDEASSLGIGPARADRLIGRLCRRLAVTREQGSIVPRNNAVESTVSPAAPVHNNGAAKFSLLRCRHCLGVTEMSPVARKAGSARCHHCGASLKWDCPICKRSLWVDEGRCNCGFRQALCEPLVRHFEAAQQSFRNFDLTRALEHLERVQEFAPNLAGARNGIARIRQRQADIARLQSVYETARAGARLIAARTAVEAWSRLVDPASAALQTAWSELTQGLSLAETLAGRARKVERTNPANARALYQQSLAIAADLPAALEGLKRTPPDAPSALEAQVMGDRIRLWWMPPAPDGFGPLTFVVVRKRGGALQHPSDGTRIAEVSTSEFEDMHVTPGDTVGYAVMSRRRDVESVTAISLGPFVFLADVKDVRVEFRHQEVELAWTRPRGVSEVRVIRKPGIPPKNPRDGDRLPAAQDHALDRNLDPNEIYYYGIYAIYAMPEGRLFPAPGVVVSARPQPPIPAIEAPRLLQEPDGRVRIEWLEPLRGSVEVLRTDRPLPFSAGTRLTAAEAESLAGRWIDATAPDRAYDLEFTGDGHCYYNPLTAWGDTWTVGHSVALSRVADPTELRANRVGSGFGAGATGIKVTLRWRWAAAADTTLVVARQGTPPQGPADPVAIVAMVTPADYDRQGCWLLDIPSSAPLDGGVDAAGRSDRPRTLLRTDSNHPEAGAWHIRVYGVIDLDGTRSFSPGLEPSAGTVLPGLHPEVTVSYVFKRPWFPGLPSSLAFRTDPPGMSIPPVVLVGHPRTVPLSADDGHVVARFPSARHGAHFQVRMPRNLSRHNARIFPDPDVEPDAVVPIRLQHPETGSTRV